jgi:hypothetical protein
MKIHDVFESDDGRAVVAGTDDRLSALSRLEILGFAGSSVLLRLHGHTTEAKLLDVSLTESLVGKRNVFLKLDIPYGVESKEFLLGGLVVR